MHPEKIIFFINSLRAGGAERVCVTLANEFYMNGIKVEVMVLNLGDSVLHKDLDPNIKIYDLKTRHARNAFLKLIGIINKKQPDKIISFSYQLSALLVFIRIFVKRKFKIISRIVNNLSKVKDHQKGFWHGKIVFFLMRLSYNGIDKFIAQTEQMKNDLRHMFPIEKDKIIVIHNPVSPKIIRSFDSVVVRNNEILFVGRLAASKAVDELLIIFSKIHEIYPQLKLRIVGDGPLKKDLQKLARKLRLEDFIIWSGIQKEMAEIYSRAKIVVLTSVFEGFPNVLVEAISLGTPVVAYDCVSGPSEIIIDGVNGFLVSERNPDHFVEALNKAMLMEWDTGQIQKSAERFLPERIGTKYREAVQNV